MHESCDYLEAEVTYNVVRYHMQPLHVGTTIVTPQVLANLQSTSESPLTPLSSHVMHPIRVRILST